MSNGRKLNTPSKKPYTPPAFPPGKVNVTDPDSRTVIVAELSTASPDFGLLRPTVIAALRELEAVGVADAPGVVLADAGYWHQDQMDELRLEHGLQILIAPDAGNRTTSRPGWNGGRYAFMRRVLQTELGKTLYKQRKALIEPVSNTPSSTGASSASNVAGWLPAGRNGAYRRDAQPPGMRLVGEGSRGAVRARG